MSTTENTLELARLCWPENKWIGLDETWRENIGVPAGTVFDPDPVVLDEEALERFDPYADWNDIRKVEDIIWERDLVMQYLNIRHSMFHSEVTEWGIAIMTLLDHDRIEQRAKAALYVLRGEKDNG